MENNKNVIYFYNSLTRGKERFEAYKPPHVGMYTCGPTIYDYPTIGNWKTYILSDLVYRVLSFNGYKVKYIMNLTDVGHLSGDNLGDSSSGEDRQEKAAKKEGLSMWEVADKYGKDFIDSFDILNLIKPEKFVRATDHIKEQIALIEKIEETGVTYRTKDGIYFDVRKYELEGNNYGQLSNIDHIDSSGSRIKPNPEKKDPRDFALWKFFATGQKRHDMEWDSPWGNGYPGWHIECSAMSMKYLGNRFEVHIGGEDLKSTHHPNEIAQSECATGEKPYVKYWIHGAFLQVDGGRMGKSLGNGYTLHDLKERGYNPLAFRYLTFSSHYRGSMNFTFDSLDAAQNTLEKIYKRFGTPAEHFFDKDERSRIKDMEFFSEFLEAVNDDINMPKALSVMWKVIDSDILLEDERYLLLSEFDQVLGLGLFSKPHEEVTMMIPLEDLPAEVRELILAREEFRSAKNYAKADEMRDQILSLGYTIEDSTEGTIVRVK